MATRERKSQNLETSGKVKSFRVFLEDGVSLYGEEFGPPSGPALVFMYGLGCAISHWQHQLAYFRDSGRKQGMRVIWVDYRGHGRSSEVTAAAPLRMQTIVTDLIAVLADRNVRKAALIGQSLGGTLALCVASAAPQIVAGVVALGAPSRAASQAMSFGPLAPLLWRTLMRVNTQKRPSLKIFNQFLDRFHLPIREVMRFTGFNPLRTKTRDVDQYVRELARTDFNVFLDLAADLEEFDIALLKPSVTCPVLQIAGTADRVIPPREVRYMQSHLKAGDIAWIEGGSHCPHHDDPQAVDFRIELFLRDIGFQT